MLPGLVVAAAEGDRVQCEAFGARRREPDEAPASVDTVYDLASLTKALATAVLTAQAVAEGRLDLDEPIGLALPVAAGQPCGAVAVRHLLSHSAGFPAHRPFYERVLGPGAAPPADGAARVIAAAAAEPLVYPPGTRSLYSDLGFILLGALLEVRLGAPLDVLFARRVAGPLGLTALSYARDGLRAGDRPLAPTERCPVRGRLIAGEVHDLNAYAMGGVAGHAGLFGSAPAVLAVARALMAAHAGEADRPLVDPEVLRLFWRPAGVPGATWRLGWDGPAPQGSLAGERLDRAAVGHLAFTGPSLWIDPARRIALVVLTNRVHPEVRDDPRWRALRPALNDACLADLQAVSVEDGGAV